MFIYTIIAGFVSGCLSGMFGVGGGIITTPAIRLFLNEPAAIAIGTPLPVMIPSVIVGVYNYSKNKLVDWALAKDLIISGLPGIILGSAATKFIAPKIIMLSTAALIGIVSISFLNPEKRTEGKLLSKLSSKKDNSALKWTVGFVCGLFSGFLGLGGGTLLIPSLIYIFLMDIKSAFGTSLAVVGAFTVPGTIVHSVIGHVNYQIALLLIAGVMPGAYLGSKIVIRMPLKLLRLLFGLLLLILALYFAFFEIKR